VGAAIRGAQSTEFVKGAGFRKSEFVGGKKYYTPMSTDPKSSGAGGDVTNITISGSSGAAVDNVGVYNISTILPIQGGHVSPITDTGYITIVEYDPIGAAAEGAVDTNAGVVSTKGEDYDLASPGTFATHFLRKDGSWADVSASLDTFKTWSWVPSGGGNPFTTVADSSGDTMSVTAAGGLDFTDTSSGTTDSLTMTVATGTSSALGVVRVLGGNAIGASYASGAVTINHDDTSSVSAADNSGTTFIQDLTFDTYGHVTARTSAAVPVYMPSGPEGGVDTGVVNTDDDYNDNDPGANNFQSHFLRKDGIFASPVASILAFKTISWLPTSGTPFLTTADATADTLSITAGTGIQFADASSGATDGPVTISSTHSVGDGGLTQKNFTTTLKSKLDGIAGSANNYLDSQAVSAMGIKGNSNALHHDRYTHPSVQHIPDNGAANQYVKYSSAGTGAWADLPVTTGANTLSDSSLPTTSGYAGIFKELSNAAIKMYSLKAGSNITLDKNNGGGEANTYIEISAAGVDVNNANWTGVSLAVGNGGTGVSTVSDLKTIVLGLGTAAYTASGDYATSSHGHSYVTSAVAGNGISVSGATGAVTITNTAPDVNHNTDVNWNCSTISGSAATARNTIGVDTDDGVEFNSFGVGVAASGAGDVRIANNLWINGYTDDTASRIRIHHSEGNAYADWETGNYYIRYDTTSKFRFNSSGQFDCAADVVAYSSSASDMRLKDTIEPMENNLEKLAMLTPISFEYKEKRDGKHLGLSAQEVEKVFPNIVKEIDMMSFGKDGEEFKTIRQQELIPVLIGAIKELKEELDELKCR